MALVGANVAVGKLLAEALPIAADPLPALHPGLPGAVAAGPRHGRTGAAGRRRCVNLALQALLGTALYNAGLLAGLRLTTALEGGLMLATLPAVVALGSALWLRERLAPRHWAAAALAAGGMAAITVARLGGEAGGSALGNALVFAGVCGEAAYVLLAKRSRTGCR